MNLDFKFLTKEQVFGDNKLNIFERYGTNAAITDFAILLGGFVSNENYYDDNDSLEWRTNFYWTCSNDSYGYVHVVTTHGEDSVYNVFECYGGARPVLSYSSIKNLSVNKVIIEEGILEVEYGQYPQKAASQKLQEKLEAEYTFNLEGLKQTNKIYVRYPKRHSLDEGFKAQSIDEYEYKGKKYVRVKANLYRDNKTIVLSNGKKYQTGDYVWVEVLPIKWLVDEENDVAIPEKLLFSGVPFNNENNYKGDFENTVIKRFMNKYFSSDIIVNVNVNVNDNINIDNIINVALFKMNEIIDEENEKGFMKVKK